MEGDQVSLHVCVGAIFLWKTSFYYHFRRTLFLVSQVDMIIVQGVRIDEVTDHLFQDLLSSALQIQGPIYLGPRDIRVLLGQYHKGIPSLESVFSRSGHRHSSRDIWQGGRQIKQTLGVMTNIFHVELSPQHSPSHVAFYDLWSEHK